MKSPLEYDEAIVKEFGIDDVLELEEKLGHARSQYQEINRSMWRARVELMVAQMQVDNATDENMRAVHQQNVNEKRVLLPQFVRSTTLLKVLVDELEAKLAE